MGPVERSVFLVGFMASGKTTVGRILADRLGVELIDTDERIARQERRTIERIFAEHGEPYFRRCELELLHALAPGSGLVVATGGGMFDDAAARRSMKRNGLTVWLDVDLDEVRRRAPAGADRPMWPAGDPLAQRILYERRRAVYALAHLRVAARPGDARQVAERVLNRTRPFFH